MSLILAALLAQVQPPEGWTETRFHRVHLRNGNFLDGQLLANVPEAVTLKVKTGELEIARDLIAKVEYLRIRSYEEKPTPVLPPEPVEADAPPAPAAVADAPASPLRTRVEGVLARARRATQSVQDAALRELAALGYDGAVVLVSLLERLDGEDGRFAGRVLRETRNPLIREPLKLLLRSPNPVARAEAVDTLSALGVETDLTGDASPLVRTTALRAMEFFRPRSSLSRSAAFAGDAHPEVRRQAIRTAFVLARAHDEGAELVRALLDVLRGPALSEARVEILDALALLRHASEWHGVADELRHEAKEVRRAAARCLGELLNAEASPSIAEALGNEESAEVKRALIESAAKLRDPALIPALIEKLSDPDLKIVNAAAESLFHISRQNLGTSRMRWEDYWNAVRGR